MRKRTTPRVCKVCGKSEEEVKFYKDRLLLCVEHNKGCKKRWKQNNQERIAQWYRDNKDHIRNNNLKRQYGLDLEQYETMLQQQGGGCAICGRREGGANQHGPVPLVVDHDHKTGQVRGLLCQTCNLVLGGLYDSPKLALAAFLYLYAYAQPVQKVERAEG